MFHILRTSIQRQGVVPLPLSSNRTSSWTCLYPIHSLPHHAFSRINRVVVSTPSSSVHGRRSSSNTRNHTHHSNNSNTFDRKQRGRKHSYSPAFIDRARIRVSGGNGGKGCLSYAVQLGSTYKKRPDGGHGGDGGFVILVADEKEQSLNMQYHHYKAQDGKNGSSQQLHGRNGKDLILRVPRGVVVKRIWETEDDYESDEEEEEELDEHEHEHEHEHEQEDFESQMENDEGDENQNTQYSNHRQDGEENDSPTKDNMIDSYHPDIHDSIHSSNTSTSWNRAIHLGFYKNNHSNSSTSRHVNFIRSHNIQQQEDIQNANDSLSTTIDTWTQSKSKTRRRQRIHPPDYAQVVNTGSRGLDGMYHWLPEEQIQQRHSDMNSSSSQGKQDHHVTDAYHDDDQHHPNGANSSPIEEKETVILADLDKAGSFVIAAMGGKGGTGNCVYAHRQYSESHTAKAAQRSVGQHGESAYIELELKMIADIGLVGFPNAGKSSLLAAMSMAKPNIAAYPFTTIHPLVGCVEYRDGYRVKLADIPGLIEGASYGRGRGHDFLRHLERTKALLYIVDSAGVDGRNPVSDLIVLFNEISSYGDGAMIQKPSLVVANKMDLIPDGHQREKILAQIGKAVTESGIQPYSDVLAISAGVTGEGLGPLSRAIRNVVEKDCNR